MNMNDETYKRQVSLLIRIMPSVYRIKDFAVHGGTAINLFHKNMPRYSVDIGITNLMSLSGGEQALVAIAIYFAILKISPSPFCLLDEIEAALDDVNVSKYAQYLHHLTDKTQFITITHRRGTMEEADVLYGVTMQEKGVSKLLKMDVSETRQMKLE